MPRKPDAIAASDLQKKCAVTGRYAPRRVMIRFVCDADGVVTPDIGAKLPGRGMWTLAERAVIETAVSRNVFGRGLGRPIRVPDDLVGLVARLLQSRCLHLLGLARRAGALVLGFEAVCSRLRRGPVALVLIASDAAPRGVDALLRLRSGAPVLLREFSAGQLGGALGRARAVYGTMDGPLAHKIAAEASRLTGFDPCVEPVGLPVAKAV